MLSHAFAYVDETGEELGRLVRRAATARHISLLHVAHTDERIAIGHRILGHAERTGDALLELQALHSRVFDRLTLVDVAGARQDHARLDALAGARRDPLHEHPVVGWAGTFAQMDGRYDEAERLALESYELRRRLEMRDAENVLAGQLFMIRRAQGRAGELVDAVEQAIELHPELAAWRAALPLVHVAAGDPERARAELEAFDLSTLPEDFFWLTAMADALAAARGETELAVAQLQDALRRSAGAPAFEARARADLNRINGARRAGTPRGRAGRGRSARAAGPGP